MNHLAHIFLSRHHPPSLVGNLCADFLKKKDRDRSDSIVKLGIKLHHWIDRYTDAHPIVKEMNLHMKPLCGRYSPVVIDVLMDHILATHWNFFDHREYQNFCESTFQQINYWLSQVTLPELVIERVRAMINDRWIANFDQESGMLKVLDTLAVRANFIDDFTLSWNHFLIHSNFYTGKFMEFFPELDAYISLRCQEFP